MFRIAGLVALFLLFPQIASAEPIVLHIGGDHRKISAEDCARKAVEAMGKEKFILAEVGKDGYAWGYDEKTAVRVLALPYKDGVHVIIVVAGKENPEAERVRNAVRAHIHDGVLDPTVPKQIKTSDTSRKGCGLSLRWGVEQRNVIPTMRFFKPAAAIVMEKQGFATTESGPALVFGGTAESALAVFAVPGPNEISAHIGVIAVNTEEAVAERLQSVIRGGIVRVLFD
jgi:hypothetical protein